MPTRMIREGLLDSTKYANVSDAARLLFIHLMLLADDFGCVNAGSTFLRRRCFYDSPSDERISKILMELVDVGLIRTYEVERACYAFIPKFRQRLKRATLKHPQPPESLYLDDSDAKEKFRQIREDQQEKAAARPPQSRPPAPEEKRSRREEKIKTLSGKPDFGPQCLEILNFLNEKAGRAYRPNRVNLELIEARLKEGASVDDCRMVIARKCREWLADEKMAIYLRPATLFNRTKFNQYIGECVET